MHYFSNSTSDSEETSLGSTSESTASLSAPLSDEAHSRVRRISFGERGSNNSSRITKIFSFGYNRIRLIVGVIH